MGDSSAFTVMNSFLNLAHVSVPQIGVEGVDGESRIQAVVPFCLLSCLLHVCMCLIHSAERSEERGKEPSGFLCRQLQPAHGKPPLPGWVFAIQCTLSVQPQTLFCAQASRVVQNKSNHVIHEVSIRQVSRFNECIWHIYQNSIIQGRNLHCT